MGMPPKTPPRFVPTLTDVVHLPDTARFAGQIIEATAASEAPQPVAAAPEGLQNLAPGPVPDADTAAGSSLPEGLEEYVVHRVMQRVDLVLDQRLREAIALVVQEQTRSMIPRLREEGESVVRHAVCEAVADELAGNGGRR